MERVKKLHDNLISGTTSNSLLIDVSNLTPQVVVITGIASGLGRALAEEYLSRGHFVAGCARRKERLQQLRQKYASSSSRILFATCDVTNKVEVEAFAAQVEERFGRVRLYQQ